MAIVSEGAREGSAYDRVPPQDLGAERSALGAMLQNKDSIATAIESVAASEFYRPAHSLIYEAIFQLFNRGEPVDAVTVADELRRTGNLEQCGGIEYLLEMADAVPNPYNGGYYAKIVHEQAQLRALVETGTRIVQLGYSTDGADVEELVNTAQAEVYAISDRYEKAKYRTLQELGPGLLAELEQNANREQEFQGIPTGFSELDKKLNGLRENQMIIIAARPGAGKSTLAMDIARSAAIKHNRPTVYFTLEMNANELAMRLLAAESNIFLDKMIKGNLDTRDWERVIKTMERIEEKPLIIDDTPNMTMAEIRAKCRRLKQHHKIELVIIDYLQLLSSSASGRRAESRQQEVSEQSRSIKLLAKELEVPIIAVSQLNRGPETRENKRPQVSDLRESGSLEQDADVVMLIHREDMYKSMNDEPTGEAEIIVGKQRSGPTGTVKLLFRGNVSCFAEATVV